MDSIRVGSRVCHYALPEREGTVVRMRWLFATGSECKVQWDTVGSWFDMEWISTQELVKVET